MRLMDPKEIVAAGYDRIGGWYGEQAGRTRAADRARHEMALIEGLPAGAEVLDLGCGAGVPTTQRLAQHFAVTGVDISERQVARAQRNVPTARFIHEDMTQLDLPPGTFDGVVAFFSIIHVPREQQSELLQAIAAWLRPEGIFVATMGAKGKASVFARDWLGVPMYWSSFDSDTNQRLITETGLGIVSAREAVYEPDGVPGRFLWLVARKPRQFREDERRLPSLPTVRP